MSTLIHCDREGCPQTRNEDVPRMLPDPWLKVEPIDGGQGGVQHFCSARHAADQLAEAADKGRR